MASRDFLGGFERAGGAQAGGAGSKADGESDEIELSLGLSLGGCFGTDPALEAKKDCLVRSSSIASIYSLPGGVTDGEDVAAVEPPPSELTRTSSLPTDYMEDHRRRAMQSQRRLAAKRKRLERRNSMNSGRSSAGAGAGRDDTTEHAHTHPSGFPPRCAVASQGSTSSSLPEQGSGSGGGAEGKSSSAMNTSPDNSSGGGQQHSSRPPAASSGERPPNGSAGREPPALRTLRSLTTSSSSSMMDDMPMVTARVDGRKVDGFLYKYRKGEEVRIVCVCHGSFLTPAEFVRHAGGGDVTNPLRHIVVNPQQPVFM